MWHQIHCIQNELFMLVISLCLLNLITYSDGFYMDPSENTEFLQQLVGQNVKLQCNLKGLVDEDKMANVRIQWFFKQCGDYSGDLLSCHANLYENNDWTPLPCDDNSFCKPILLLHNVTEKYSGLYKCTAYLYTTSDKHIPDLQLVRTYQLDVKTHIEPDILDTDPLPKSIVLGSQLVFQCRVYSENYPTIKWFRRLSLKNGTDIKDFVSYNGHAYELLDTPREKLISKNEYLSKLILNEVKLEDTGYYACVAITIKSHSIRETHLEVLDNDQDYWMDYDEEAAPTDPKEFWLLFLMPLGLAILPLTVWLCYVLYKRRKDPHKRLAIEEPQYSEGEFAADRCVLRV